MKQLINVMEEVVRMSVEDYLKDADMCKCENCKNDIMAIMLNTMPAIYVNTDKGALYSKLNEFDPQYHVNLLVAQVEAANTVDKNPRH